LRGDRRRPSPRRPVADREHGLHQAVRSGTQIVRWIGGIGHRRANRIEPVEVPQGIVRTQGGTGHVAAGAGAHAERAAVREEIRSVLLRTHRGRIGRQDQPTLPRRDGPHRRRRKRTRLRRQRNMHGEFVRDVRIAVPTQHETGSIVRNSGAGIVERRRSRCHVGMGWRGTYHHTRWRHDERIERTTRLMN